MPKTNLLVLQPLFREVKQFNSEPRTVYPTQWHTLHFISVTESRLNLWYKAVSLSTLKDSFPALILLFRKQVLIKKNPTDIKKPTRFPSNLSECHDCQYTE